LDTFTIKATANPNYKYSWNPPNWVENRDTLVRYVMLDKFQYRCDITVAPANKCKYFDTITVDYSRLLEDLEAIATPARIEFGDSSRMLAKTQNGVDFVWSPKETLDKHLVPSPWAKPKVNTIYEVVVKDRYGCRKSDTAEVEVNYEICDDPEVYVPNAFTFNNGKVFFLQLRPGLNAKPFKIIKFKTMRDAFNIKGDALPDEVRLTRIGQLIRSTSLDELLQLINVVKGDMSLVGPRPLLMKYLNRYSKEQLRRHEVKPGITGWAQVNGRNAISWEEKFRLDVEYVNNQTFCLDVKILWLTVVNVIRRKDISADGNVTIKEFEGSNT
jgi:hypothetical protein